MIINPRNCKVPVYTWVESGIYGLMSCQRTVVPGRDLNPTLGLRGLVSALKTILPELERN